MLCEYQLQFARYRYTVTCISIELLWNFICWCGVEKFLKKSLYLLIHTTLYRCSIVHRDVKPHNILLDFGYNALLGDADHGIELPENASHVTATNAVGTLGYEDRYRAKGDGIRCSEDLFSLGIG